MIRSVIIASILCLQFATAAWSADNSTGAFSDNSVIPTYKWSDSSVRPRGVVICIHGLTSNGKAYDVLAKRLASAGFVVLAPDLRGFGRWYQDVSSKSNSKIDYEQSMKDLEILLEDSHAQYGNLPIMCLGESLGAAMSFDLVNGHKKDEKGPLH
jgi:acylglycerol lipase